ncbi:ATP-binding cassette domain-containing protein [Micromonospora sp. NPDC048830]|uniref:ATP-binding cassette domain-containing protein n=1 Tax=Micromonospora sp. NPDC048830 TaxID=3364257 RepID=UPI003710CE4E
MTGTQPFLQVSGVRKAYGHVQALRGVDLEVRTGEVHALLGDNGAGKSTLMKILAGVTAPDSGEIRVGGKPVTARSPRDMQAAGVATVFQDLALAPSLDAGENVFLGREITRPGLLGRLGFVDRAEMRRRTQDQIAALGSTIPSLRVPVGSLSGGQRQAVAIARAAVWGSAMLMLDEPTAALGVRQTEQVLELIRRVRTRGDTAVLLISHNLPDVFAVADRVTVLRLGAVVLDCHISKTSIEKLTLVMAGVKEAP